MSFVQGIINNNLFCGNSKPLTVDNSHIFTDTAERDSYFITNPSELMKDVYIQVGVGFQLYTGSEWKNVSALLKGQDGIGIPSLGTTSQILSKKTNSSFDTEWVDKFPIRVVTDNYVATSNDYIIMCNFATEKNMTLDVNGSVFIVKSIGDGVVNFLSVLDGISNFKLYKGSSVMVANYGSNFVILASAGYGI